MAKGWTVRVITHERGFRGERVRQQLFDVAIEDKERAVEAVRHRVWERPDALIEATAQLDRSRSLRISPGQVRVR